MMRVWTVTVNLHCVEILRKLLHVETVTKEILVAAYDKQHAEDKAKTQVDIRTCLQYSDLQWLPRYDKIEFLGTK